MLAGATVRLSAPWNKPEIKDTIPGKEFPKHNRSEIT
jgi:hypothetical protein